MDYTVTVMKDEYLGILGFTMYSFFTGRITKYSGITGGQRTLGEYIEHFIYGKVAEVGFRKFLQENLSIETLTDADLAGFILGVYLPDLVAVKDQNNQWDVLRFWTDVKEVKESQKWLLIPAQDKDTVARPYDAYVAVWVDLPKEHLYALLSQAPDVQDALDNDWKQKAEKIAEKVSSIQCEIKGFVLYSDIENVKKALRGDSTAENTLNEDFSEGGWGFHDPEDDSLRLEGLNNIHRKNYGFKLGSLRNSEEDWMKFREFLISNRRTVSRNISFEGVKPPKQYQPLYAVAKFLWDVGVNKKPIRSSKPNNDSNNDKSSKDKGSAKLPQHELRTRGFRLLKDWLVGMWGKHQVSEFEELFLKKRTKKNEKDKLTRIIQNNAENSKIPDLRDVYQIILREELSRIEKNKHSLRRLDLKTWFKEPLGASDNGSSDE